MRLTWRAGGSFCSRPASGLAAVVTCLLASLGTPQARAEDEPSGAQRAAATIARARELTAQLANEKYETRQEAMRELLDLGVAALRPLNEALASPDPEVRARAGELLVALRGRGFVGIELQETSETSLTIQAGRRESAEEQDEDPRKRQPAQPPAEFVQPPGVVARDVLQNMPAERAGFQNGDRIVSVNGQAVHGSMDFMREVGLAGPGQSCLVVVEREGKPLTLAVTPTRHPYDVALVDLRSPADRERESNLPLDPRVRPILQPQIILPEP